MKLIKITATDETFDKKTNTLTYSSDVTADAGVLLHADKSGEKDMLIVNQIHDGGKVTVVMKPFRTPARKYFPGDVVAVLMLSE